MNLRQFVDAQYGRGAALAAALGVAPVMVYQWAAGVKPVPVARCAAIERATAGEVTRKDLRPHDWAEHWPELAEQPGQGGSELAHEAG